MMVERRNLFLIRSESGLRATLLSWSPLQKRFLEPSAPREVFAIKCVAKSHDGRAEKPIFNPIFGWRYPPPHPRPPPPPHTLGTPLPPHSTSHFPAAPAPSAPQTGCALLAPPR